ncbi:MAG TPA: TrmH family RNA methyltransferase [Spirochaetia bacterium]|nr:TrmH family RNA methyltransferase [Spirochaetia bacterium]
MFPLRKLRELSQKTRLRKVARILQALEAELAGAGRLEDEYARELAQLLAGDAPEPIRQDALLLERLLGGAEALSGAETSRVAMVLRAMNVLRNDLLHELHAEPAEWDLVDHETRLLSRVGVNVLPLRVYLEDVRSPYNVGSIFRTAEAFGAERVLLSKRTPLPTHPRASKAAMRSEQAMPWAVADLEFLRGTEGLFALELGGTPLNQFSFPRSGTVLLGSEELGLSPEALDLADTGLGRVSIPLVGAKKSLNVAVAFGILMEAWRSAVDPR